MCPDVHVHIKYKRINTTLWDKFCQWFVADRWFSSCTPVSSTNKTDRHDITKVLLKVALNTLTLTRTSQLAIVFQCDYTIYLFIYVTRMLCGQYQFDINANYLSFGFSSFFTYSWESIKKKKHQRNPNRKSRMENPGNIRHITHKNTNRIKTKTTEKSKKMGNKNT